MKKNTILLLVSVTLGVVVTLGGVFLVNKFPQLVQVLKKPSSTVIEKDIKKTPPITLSENDIGSDDVESVLQQPEDSEEEPTQPTQPDPIQVTQYPAVGENDSVADNVQDYVPDRIRQTKKQVVLNKTPLSVQGGVAFSGGIMVNADRAMKGLTFNSDGKMGDWHFGDGTMATGTQVQHAYGEKGSYKVSFLAEESGTVYITQKTIIVGGVVPMFITDNFTPRVDESVTIDASGSISAVGSITNYKWTCGEAQESQCIFSNQMGVESSLQFTEPGVYFISLTTTNNIGVNETVRRMFAVSGEKPVAKISSISPSLVPRHPGEYELNARGSVNVLGEAKDLSYEWDFDGDGEWDETTTDPIIQYEYTESGEKTVRLRVGYEKDGKTILSEVVTDVISGVSTLWVDFEVPYVLVVDESFLFQAQGPEGGEYTWKIDKESSSIKEVEEPLDKSISFHDAGTYAVTLTITLNKETESITKSISVRSKDMPMALLQYSIDKGASWKKGSSMFSIMRNERGNTELLVKAHAVDGMGALGCDKADLNYSWSVRGVPISTECNPGVALNVYFSKAETYPVQLTVYQPGNQNKSDTTSFLIEIKNINPEFLQPISYETNTSQDSFSKGPVSFLVTAEAQDVDTDIDIRQYFFEPLENGIVLPDTQLLDMGQAYFDLSQYKGIHELSFRVTATDNDGGRTVSQGMGTYTFQNSVQGSNKPPVITDFTVSKLGASKGELVRFNVLAQDPENDKLTYRWIISQEGTVLFSEQTEEAFFLYSFSEIGTYTVEIEISDGINTVSSEEQRMIYIRE